MRHLIRGLVCVLAGFATVATAADRLVVGPVPDWVQPAATEIAPAAATNAALQVLLSDQQLRFSPAATETYVDSRVRIQTPQGLQTIGTIALRWLPDADVITMHRLIVRRGTQVRDLLGNGDGFTVLRREDMLEQATLTGMLTAIMQPPDLQVGDIVEFSYTRRHADPVVPDKPDMQSSWGNAPIQNIHFRAQWPKQMAVRWQLRDFKPELKESVSGDNQTIDFTLQNPPPLLQPAGAPVRYAALRRVELTTFQSWPEVSKRLAQLYVAAAKLAQDSPLHAEIARIRTASADPKVRVAAALQLVQDQVRYVLLAMNEGALVPATADQTWQRRYGDCKAKTALLLALLRELGIDAEPVMVNTSMGDGIDQLLPGISLFDHVLVRAQIAGKAFWLDGTRLGDRQLDRLHVPAFRWGLPLTARGSELVRIEQMPLAEPELTREISLDASNGVDAPVPFRAKVVFHDDDALSVKLSQDNLDATQRDQSMRNYWRNKFDSLQVDKVEAVFDETGGTMTWSAQGTLPLDWDDTGYHEIDYMQLGYRPDLTRPAGTNAEAPYAVSYPEYTQTRFSMKLPAGNSGFAIYGTDIDKTISGWEYKRSARIADGVFSAESSVRSIVPEISSKEAHDNEAALRELYKNRLFVQKPQKAAEDPSAAELQSQAGKPLATAAEYMQRGYQMTARNLHELAEKDFTAALDKDPELIGAWIGRGLARAWLQHTDAALADFESALKREPESPDALIGIGMTYGNQKRYAEAIAPLSKALQLRDDPNGRGMRANAYVQLGRYEEAQADFDALCKASSTVFNECIQRADILMRLKRPEDVREMAEEALATHRGRADGAAFAALLYSTAGDLEKARGVLTQAINKAPSPDLYSSRASMTTNVDMAVEDLQQALKMNPKYFPALLQLAPLQGQQKKYAEELSTLDELDRLDPATGTQLMRGEAMARLGRMAAARDAYDAARKVARNAARLNSLCWSEVISSDTLLEDALADCNASLAQKPDSAATLDSRGLVFLKMKSYDKAVDSYDAAIALSPTQAASLFGRGVARFRLGRQAEGDADIKAAEALSPDIEARFADYGVKR